MIGKPSVLVVDDDPGIRETMSDILALEEFPADVASSGDEAVAMFALRFYDVVLLDMTMPGMDGIATMHALRRISPTLRVIVVTGCDEGTVAAKAIQHEVDALFEKPLDIEACLDLLGKQQNAQGGEHGEY